MPVLEAPFITIIRDCPCGGAGCRGEVYDDTLILVHTYEYGVMPDYDRIGRLTVKHVKTEVF